MKELEDAMRKKIFEDEAEENRRAELEAKLEIERAERRNLLEHEIQLRNTMLYLEHDLKLRVPDKQYMLDIDKWKIDYELQFQLEFKRP
jgi:hypothetical protein